MDAVDPLWSGRRGVLCSNRCADNRNQDRQPLTASSWFETGLMNPAPGSAAWAGAQWIGGGDPRITTIHRILGMQVVEPGLDVVPGLDRDRGFRDRAQVEAVLERGVEVVSA